MHTHTRTMHIDGWKTTLNTGRLKPVMIRHETA